MFGLRSPDRLISKAIGRRTRLVIACLVMAGSVMTGEASAGDSRPELVTMPHWQRVVLLRDYNTRVVIFVSAFWARRRAWWEVSCCCANAR